MDEEHSFSQQNKLACEQWSCLPPSGKPYTSCIDSSGKPYTQLRIPTTVSIEGKPRMVVDADHNCVYTSSPKQRRDPLHDLQRSRKKCSERDAGRQAQKLKIKKQMVLEDLEAIRGGLTLYRDELTVMLKHLQSYIKHHCDTNV